MSLKYSNLEKANSNMCKFIENTQRIINATKVILERLMDEHDHIASDYSDVPMLLDIGKRILVDIGSQEQVKLVKTFVEKSIPVWEKVKNKDITVLTENMSLILSDNPFVPRIQYMYGSNPQRRCYVNEKETKNMWTLITALIHNSVKYVYFSGNTELMSIIPDGTIEMFNINLE